MAVSVFRFYSDARLSGFWAKVRSELEKPGTWQRLHSGGGVKRPVPVDADRRVALLPGLPRNGVPAGAAEVRIDLAALHRKLADDYGTGLPELTAACDGRGPVVPKQPAGAARAERVAGVRSGYAAALTEHGLDAAPWAPAWLEWLVRGVSAEQAEVRAGLAGDACRVLARMHLDPALPPSAVTAKVELAQHTAAGSHGLDGGRRGPLADIVLRAAALAHRAAHPATREEEKALWERCGVSDASAATTVLARGLRFASGGRWAAHLAERADLGLALHLDGGDLACARAAARDGALIAPGTIVWACENTHVVEAARSAGAQAPLLCLSGQFSVLALQWVRLLSEAGAEVRYHGDFDWGGLHIARRVLELPGTAPWRMAEDDYTAALAARDGGGPHAGLRAGNGSSPWSKGLAPAMKEAGKAVEEERPAILRLLLADLGAK
ncbi:DUF2399 domain-containing protein [Nocardiopsis coralliicola]